ncbi:MAG: YCF48-related protein [Crocinitomicaceae bacterium]|nr:YCF48-related protein [Crocinitomicaceae bacterium]
MKLIVIIITLLLSGIVSSQDWYEISTPTTQNLNAIDFPSQDVGYIVGDSGTLLKSINGGQSWDEVIYTGIDLGPGPYNFIDVDFVDELEGYITIHADSAFKTTDGGLTWTSTGHPMSNQCFPNSIFVAGNDNVFIGGVGCFQGPLIDQFNAGSWTVSTVNYPSWDTGEYIEEIDFYDNTIGLAALHSQYFLRTEDGGATWDTIFSGLPSGYLTSVVMIDNQLCYAGYNQSSGGFGLLISVDGGLTWFEDVSSASFAYPEYNAVATSNNGSIYAGGKPSSWTGGIISAKTITGFGWNIYNVTHTINGMESYGADVTFAVGDSGYVVVNTPLSSLGIEEFSQVESGSLPYPVPADEFVQFNIVKEDVNSIEAYTLSGQQLLLTVNSNSPSTPPKFHVTNIIASLNTRIISL